MYLTVIRSHIFERSWVFDVRTFHHQFTFLRPSLNSNPLSHLNFTGFFIAVSPYIALRNVRTFLMKLRTVLRSTDKTGACKWRYSLTTDNFCFHQWEYSNRDMSMTCDIFWRKLFYGNAIPDFFFVRLRILSSEFSVHFFPSFSEIFTL